MKGKVTIVDNGLDDLLKIASKDVSIKVGVLGAKASNIHSDSSVTVATVAAVHETGAGVPRRSWLRDWIDQNAGEIGRTWERVLGPAFRAESGTDLRRQAGRFGLWAVGQIQQRITRGIGPQLAASTLKQKGSSVPLIDSGQFRASITSEVEK